MYDDTIKRFLSQFLNRFRYLAHQREDIEQELRLACWIAAPKYDPARAQPVTYFWTVCLNAAYTWRVRHASVVRRPRRHGTWCLRGRPDMPLVEDDHDTPVLDAVPDDWTPAMLASLPSRERYIVEQIALHDRTQTELAAELRISTQRAHQLYTRALEKLRVKMIRDRIMV